MQVIVCPICSREVNTNAGKSECTGGHGFPIVGGVVDLLQNTSDGRLKEEEQHWNTVAMRGRNVIVPHKFINRKIIEDCQRIYRKVITKHWPEFRQMSICIGEIGSNYGSATNYLGEVEFSSVDYIGVDVSLKALQLGVSGKSPVNWNKQYVRASVSSKTFKSESLDIVVCVGALHHFDLNRVFDWVPSSIKHGGLLILHEPSLSNPVARIARKMVKGFHTPGEKPLNPSEIKRLAEQHDLILYYEKGLHFINGSFQYLMGKYNAPRNLVIPSYYLLNCIDKLIVSPSLAYSFIQIYRKV